MAMKVITPGALTTVQDGGRYGYQSTGIGVGGCMDMDSYRKANYLVGNEKGEAVLEFTLIGGMLELTEETVLALTGADMAPKQNGEPVPMNVPLAFQAGDVLELGMAGTGCRCYLAVAGGIEVPLYLGSRSTNLKCKFGGYQGRALQRGDVLEVGKSGKPYEQLKDRECFTEEYPNTVVVRVIEGPQEEYFTKKGKKTFYKSVYTVSDKSDRMGCRLDGPAVESFDGTDIISDGIAPGSVQVPADGKPIVLLADRQTTGGYAKIASVCSFDIPKLAQCKPGNKVRFQKITLEKAQRIMREAKKDELF